MESEENLWNQSESIIFLTHVSALPYWFCFSLPSMRFAAGTAPVSAGSAWEVGLCILLVCAVDFIGGTLQFPKRPRNARRQIHCGMRRHAPFGFLFGWFEAGAAGILEPVLLFSCVFAAINYRVHSMNRREEEKLNRIIREKLGR